jgi:hypothetical protein
MERVVPLSTLCRLIEPAYPKAGNGRPPIGAERMLRIYFLQHCFNLSDPAVEEAQNISEEGARHHTVAIEKTFLSGSNRSKGA